jgi:hypothetical protein
VTDIVLTDEQYRQLAVANGPVRVRNPRGVEIGLFTPSDTDSAPLKITVEELAEINRRMQKTNPRWFTTTEVLEHLQSRAKECDK